MRLHARPLNCPLQHLPLALSHFLTIRNTHKAPVFRHLVCVCGEHLVDFQHPQHGAQNGLHSHDGRVVHVLPYYFDPQECACGVHYS